MAITNGINIGCSDIVGAGGIRNILIRTWAEDDLIVYANTSTTHNITSIKNDGNSAIKRKNQELERKQTEAKQ